MVQASARLRSLSAESLWSVVVEVATLVAGLLAFFVLASRLGPGDYGLFVGVQAVVSMAVMMSSSWVVLLLLERSVRDSSSIAVVVSTCLTLYLGAALVALLLALCAELIIIPQVSADVALMFSTAEIFGGGLTSLSSGISQAQRGYIAGMKFRLIYLGGRVACLAALAVTDFVSLRAVAVCYCVCGILIGTAALCYTFAQEDLRFRLCRPDLVEVRRGLSYCGSLAFFVIQEDSDKLLLVRLADPAVGGLYSAAYRFVQIALIPIRGVVSATHNSFLCHDAKAINQHLRRSVKFTIVGLAYSVLAMVVLLVGAELLPDILGSPYAGSSLIIMYLTPLVALRAASLFAVNGLMGLGKNGLRVTVIAVSAVSGVVTVLVTVPTYSWKGAALGTLVSEVVLIVAAWVVLWRAQSAHNLAVTRAGSGES